MTMPDTPIPVPRPEVVAWRDVRREFPKGMRVQSSSEWDESARAKPFSGVVVGWSRDGRTVRVLPDGLATIYNYAPAFLSPPPGAEP